METEIPQEALDQMKREGWASLEEQKTYWENKERHMTVCPQCGESIWSDSEKCWRCGRPNLPLDFTEATCRWYDEWWQPAPDEERDAYINDSGGGSVEDL